MLPRYVWIAFALLKMRKDESAKRIRIAFFRERVFYPYFIKRKGLKKGR